MSGVRRDAAFYMDPVLSILNKQFADIDQRSRALLGMIADDKLYLRPRPVDRQLKPFSCGEYILRSAAMVEKTFGGLTTRMWDDPFEWTLPEKLSTKASVTVYLDEVESTRVDGFNFIRADDQLMRTIPSPEKMRTILEILVECISHSSHYQGRAFAILQTLSDDDLPRL